MNTSGANELPAVQQALARLNALLPLAQRQASLSPALRALHREILRSFVSQGRPLDYAQMAALAGDDLAAALQQLADDDLVVLAPDRRTLTGAYPFTTEPRVHRVTVNGHPLHAMCALDALSVAPMFDLATQVQSCCQVQEKPVDIRMQGSTLITASPGHPQVGIRWQSTSGCAAQSLCLDMIFLYDAATAASWQAQDCENRDLFALPEAVAFGAAFFRPLLTQ
ncbi:MAG: organomercurial lyase [Thiogranum sp.]|nr:organomercurial lyase [Thiogranum sp.]